MDCFVDEEKECHWQPEKGHETCNHVSMDGVLVRSSADEFQSICKQEADSLFKQEQTELQQCWSNEMQELLFP